MKATVGSARERYGLWVGREGVGAEQWRGKTMTWWNGDKKAGEKT